VSALNASHGSQQHIDGANVAQTFIADQQQNAQSATNGSKTYTPSVKNEDFVVTRTITFFAGGTGVQPRWKLPGERDGQSETDQQVPRPQ